MCKQKRVWHIFFKKCFCETGETRIMENSADWVCFLWHSRITFGICCTYRKSVFAEMRAAVLNNLPIGFDWTNLEYIKSFSKPILVFTCIYYGVFNVLVGPITEELFFRGYLTSHYKKQSSFTPILIAVLFSLYHFWLPFNNVFRILAFAPVAYVAYKKKNIYISICFHCICNLFSVVSFILEIMG